MKMKHLFKYILVSLTCVSIIAHALTISKDTYLGDSDLSSDITIDKNYFLALVNSNFEKLQNNLVVEGSLFIGDTDKNDADFTTFFTGSELQNDGLIVVDGRHLTYGSMTVSWNGSSITNNGRMYFNGLNSDSNSFQLNPSSSLTNNGLMYFGQDSSSNYGSSVQLKSNAFTNDGTICLKNVKAYLESSISGSGCITIGENSLYAIQSSKTYGVLGPQTLYMNSSSSMIYVDSFGETNNIYVRGFGGGNFLTFGTSIIWHTYDTDTGVLSFTMFLFVSHKINIGTGYDKNGFSMETITNHISWRLLNNALTYSGSAPSGIPDACKPCDSSPWIPVISTSSSLSSMPTTSSISSKTSTISPSSTIISSSVSTTIASSSLSSHSSSSFVSTPNVMDSSSILSSFTSTASISSSSSLLSSSVTSSLVSSTSTTSIISSPNASSSEDSTVSVTLTSTDSQGISSITSSSLNNSRLSSSTTSIVSSLIYSSMSGGNSTNTQSSTTTLNTTTLVTSIPSSSSVVPMNISSILTSKASFSLPQNSAITKSVLTSASSITSLLLASSSATSMAAPSSFSNVTSEGTLTSSLTPAASSPLTPTSAPMGGHSFIISSSPISLSVLSQFEATSLPGSSFLREKTSSLDLNGISVITSSLTATAAPKQTYSIGRSDISYLNSFSNVESVVETPSTVVATSTSSNVSNLVITTHYITDDRVITEVITVPCPYLHSETPSITAVGSNPTLISGGENESSFVSLVESSYTGSIETPTTQTESNSYTQFSTLSKAQSSFVSLVESSYTGSIETPTTQTESNSYTQFSTLSKAQESNKSFVVSQSDSNGVTLIKTSHVNMETTVVSTGNEEFSNSNEMTSLSGTSFSATTTTTAVTKTLSSTNNIANVNGVETYLVSQETGNTHLTHSSSTYILQENANSGYKSQIGDSLLSVIALYVFFII